MLEPVDPRRPVRDHLSRQAMALKGIPVEFFDADLETYPVEDDLKLMLTNYIRNLAQMKEDCICLFFYGANGTGKTYLSSVIAREAYRQRYTSMRITVESYIQLQFQRSEEAARERLARIKGAEFLVIDELGKEQFGKTNHNVVILEELLRERETQGLPTIICTNLPLEGPQGIQGIYGGSVHSLISGNYLKVIFEDVDHRKETTMGKRGLELLRQELED